MLRFTLAATGVLCIFATFSAAAAGTSGSSLITTMRMEVDGANLGALTGCEEFGSESEIIEVQSGGATGNTTTVRIPGATKFLNIVCTFLLTNDKTLANWRKAIEDGNLTSARKNGSLIMMDNTGAEVTRYNFGDGWPSSLKIKWEGASSTTRVTETISIVIESLARQ